MSSVPEHLARMMTERNLGDTALFAVPETPTDDRGLLPPAAVKPIREWLEYLADSQLNRSKVILQTLNGAISYIETELMTVVDAINAQATALDQLRNEALDIYAETSTALRAQCCDGTVLIGEVLSRWDDYIETGEFMAAMESGFKDRVARFFAGRPSHGIQVGAAVKSGLESLLIEAGANAASRVEASWLAQPAGGFVLEQSGKNTVTIGEDYPNQVDTAVSNWQSDIIDLVEKAGLDKQKKVRMADMGTNAAAVSLMLATIADTVSLTDVVTGGAGHPMVVSNKVLELTFGEAVIPQLKQAATERLGQRIDDVLEADLIGLLDTTVKGFPVETVDPQILRQTGQDLQLARKEQMARLQASTIYEVESADE
jgi:hypothetical protein